MRASTNTILLVVLVVVAILLASGIACVVYVSQAFREFEEGFGGVTKMVELQRLVKPLRSALKTYVSEHKEFPKDLGALEKHIDPETLSSIKQNFQYTPTKEESQDSTVIAQSHDVPSFEDSYFRIEVHKDLSVWFITRQKVPEDEKELRAPFSKM